ncbi:type IV pilus modification PilV family protein [Ferrimonas lipolytica]|uniref:Prepilin-type N-terminal cleavage/methylation domain-containing protein n=1 Tax=Ferrimonas lipolytica TaxID=2724191 RepID=A0A6H1UFN3_9GAMM|nr:prepilin-type N-terminal cleavage/methylation domain-containing protein [Ferrimonas lipolytica]QIZ77915.1 prepilin-type N-terminal cleavage/methylation domain-containing protein [Ferrimonas lipolytica]
MQTERGFTLIEAVIGMVVLAISLTLLSTLLYPLAERSADAFIRAQNAQVGKAVLAELNGRHFDRTTPAGGGTVTSITCCGDDGNLCPGADSDPREWQLLDNFHNYQGNAEELLGGDHYDRFEVGISVNCQRSAGWQGDAKSITVTVTSPSGEAMKFSQMRGNF